MEEDLAEFEKEQALLPPGYKFQPHDDELITHYLYRKVRNQEIPSRKVVEVDVYKFSAKELLEKYKKYGENRWYFFTRLHMKHPKGSRPNRVAVGGYWKASGGDQPVYRVDEEGNKIKVGYKKALTFWTGKVKSSYIMHEFMTLEDVKAERWVLCSIYDKSSSSSSNAIVADTQRQTQDVNVKGDSWAFCIYEKGSSSGSSTAIFTDTEIQTQDLDGDGSGGCLLNIQEKETDDLALIKKMQRSEDWTQSLDPDLACLLNETTYDDFYMVFGEGRDQGLHCDQFQFGSNLGTTGATTECSHSRDRSSSESDSGLGTNGANCDPQNCSAR